ncbi:hypothetical protein PHPALM_30511 [Phytophthora palmivora]|uniref:Uncharacterized protein n=1 Tax=Phytophthora palmivora TaxID=4796 RepID=A0A2P4X4X6_9STRA|nr:hypothetical protein PHPALM_30511 [Phytophthora palmivora]
MSCEPSDRCQGQGKVLICLVTGRKLIFELGGYSDYHRSPKTTKLTSCQNAFASQWPKSVYAHSAFGTQTLRVLSFVNYYGRTKLKNHDRVKVVKKWIHVFDGTEDENPIFTFSWENDNNIKRVSVYAQ